LRRRSMLRLAQAILIDNDHHTQYARDRNMTLPPLGLRFPSIRQAGMVVRDKACILTGTFASIRVSDNDPNSENERDRQMRVSQLMQTSSAQCDACVSAHTQINRVPRQHCHGPRNALLTMIKTPRVNEIDKFMYLNWCKQVLHKVMLVCLHTHTHK
jgi:hypothetical protein